MASFTPRYGFNDEDVSQMARCTDQAEFLYQFRGILTFQHKIIDLED